MTAKEEFVKQATIIAQRKTNEATVIDAAIASTRSDFAQYHGLSLIGTDPITGAATEYTTLDIDTAAIAASITAASLLLPMMYERCETISDFTV